METAVLQSRAESFRIATERFDKMLSYISTHARNIILLLASLPSCLWAAPFEAICKLTPDSPKWPSAVEWEALNRTIGGRLIKPTPFAAVCHANQPTFNPSRCAATDWTAPATYANSPIGIMTPNFSNDSCLPQPQYPCSGEGFPIYVINASCADHAAAGIDFARGHNIRLNVKGSGHDYLGRYFDSFQKLEKENRIY